MQPKITNSGISQIYSNFFIFRMKNTANISFFVLLRQYEYNNEKFQVIDILDN